MAVAVAAHESRVDWFRHSLSEVLDSRDFSIRGYANNGRNAKNVGNTSSGRDFTAVGEVARAEFYPQDYCYSLDSRYQQQ